MDDDRDITESHHGGDEFSVAAHERVRISKVLLRAKIEDYVREQGDRGATCDEVEAVLGLSHQSASPRFTELRANGTFVWDGVTRRRTRTGAWARVHVIASRPRVEPMRPVVLTKHVVWVRE
jgi:hypothetical protein